MARRSQRLSETTSEVAKHKRAASGSSLAGAKVKRSKNIAPTSKTTPTKSQYFQENDTSEDADSPSDDDNSSESDFDDEESASDESPDLDDVDSEAETKATPAKSRTSATTIRTKNAGGKPDLEPGVEVIIKKPKARPAGKIPYADETIHPNTLLFLGDLKANNKREWLKSE